MTVPAVSVWPSTDPQYNRSEVSALIGSGQRVWEQARSDVLTWQVKRRSGFNVNATGPATAGKEMNIVVNVLGFKIVEPVKVLHVVQDADRVGFSYSTLPGHPVSGQEAFIVWRKDNDVFLTVRSLTRSASTQPWKAIYPLLRLARRVVRRRYLNSLR